MAILDGQVQPSQFASERIGADDVQALLRRVEVTPSDAFTARIGPEMPVRLTIERDGQEPIVGEKTSYRGFHSDPMGWGEVRVKYDGLVEGHVDAVLGSEIADAAARLDTIRVKNLTALLARV